MAGLTFDLVEQCKKIVQDQAYLELIKAGKYYDLKNQIHSDLGRDTAWLVQAFLNDIVGLNIFKNMKTIQNGYCSHNPYITKVVIPDTVTGISEEAFFGCDSLTSVTMENSVKHIGKFAFAGCKNLTKIKLSENIDSLPDALFASNSSLKQIKIPFSVTDLGKSVFNNTPEDLKILVDWRTTPRTYLSGPESEMDFYKQHIEWIDKPTSESLSESLANPDTETKKLASEFFKKYWAKLGGPRVSIIPNTDTQFDVGYVAMLKYANSNKKGFGDNLATKISSEQIKKLTNVVANEFTKLGMTVPYVQIVNDNSDDVVYNNLNVDAINIYDSSTPYTASIWFDKDETPVSTAQPAAQTTAQTTTQTATQTNTLTATPSNKIKEVSTGTFTVEMVDNGNGVIKGYTDDGVHGRARCITAKEMKIPGAKYHINKVVWDGKGYWFSGKATRIN